MNEQTIHKTTRLGLAIGAGLAGLLVGTAALAQEAVQGTAAAAATAATEILAEELTGVPLESQFVFNTFSFLVTGALVMWMAAGFAMLESGLVRSKNTATICLKNISLYSVAGSARLPHSGQVTTAGRWTASLSRAAMRRPRTGSSRWCSSPLRRRSSPAPWPSASASGRSCSSPSS